MFTTSGIVAVWVYMATGSIWKAFVWTIIAAIVLQVGYFALVARLVYQHRISEETEANQDATQQQPVWPAAGFVDQRAQVCENWLGELCSLVGISIDFVIGVWRGHRIGSLQLYLCRPGRIHPHRLPDPGGLCRGHHRNRLRRCADGRLRVFAGCSTRAKRRNRNGQGSNRRRMNVQWQVSAPPVELRALVKGMGISASHSDKLEECSRALD